MGAGKVEPSGINEHEQRGALPVMGASSALAKGTASIRPAGEAKTASTARPKALVSLAKNKAVHGHEMALQEVPLEGKREHGTMPQHIPNEGKHKPDWPLQKVSSHDNLSTWEVGNAGQEIETPSKKGERKVDGPPQGSPNEVLLQRKNNPPPRRDQNEGALALWDPREAAWR